MKSSLQTLFYLSSISTTTISFLSTPKTNRNEVRLYSSMQKELKNLGTKSIQEDFVIFSNTNSKQEVPWIYLDSAATSQKPKSVIDAIKYYYENENSNVHRGAHSVSRLATSAYEQSRDIVSSFINSNSRREVIFTSGATEAINLIANSMEFEEGDEILCGELDHHSNIVPFQIVKDKNPGVELKFISVAKDMSGYNLEEFESLLSDKTKLVAVQHVSNVLGCIHPISDVIVPMIREKAPNAKILLDACQSVPNMKVDVQELGVDFLAASGHKMCGPTGIGFLWGKEELLNGLRPFMGGGEMIVDVTREGSTYAASPSRFEAGTPPIAQAIGLGAAIQYLQNIGMDNIHNYEQEIGAYLYQRLSTVPGITVLGPKENRVALAAFVSDEAHASDICTFLDVEGIAIRGGHHCCQPLHRALGYGNSARASLYFYNTKEDVDIFITKLEETLAFLQSLK